MYVHKGAIVFAGTDEKGNTERFMRKEGVPHLKLDLDTNEARILVSKHVLGVDVDETLDGLRIITEMTRIGSLQLGLEFILTQAYKLRGQRPGRRVKKNKG